MSTPMPWDREDPLTEALYQLRMRGAFYSWTEASGDASVEMPQFPHTLTFELQPEPRATLSFPDGSIETIPLHTDRDAYEHVLMDAINGELRHFVGTHETLAAWRYTDRLRYCLRYATLETYSERTPFLKHARAI